MSVIQTGTAYFQDLALEQNSQMQRLKKRSYIVRKFCIYYVFYITLIYEYMLQFSKNMNNISNVLKSLCYKYDSIKSTNTYSYNLLVVNTPQNTNSPVQCSKSI